MTAAKAAAKVPADSHAAVAAALSVVRDQPRVKTFLESAVRENRLSHAYLFVGAPGSGMHDAARALAQCVVCPSGGDGTCDECIRVRHGSHPDVHFLKPESVTGYLVKQVRELIDDVQLTPIRSHAKVYVIDRAELLRSSSANALLKTIEEPPAGVYFVLIARSADAVLPTIVSRCQAVPFRIVSPTAAADEVALATGLTGAEATIALAVAGTPDRAAEFLSNPQRREARRAMVRAIAELPRDDSWDVLQTATELLEAIKAPSAEFADAQKAMAEKNADFLTPKAMKQLEQEGKRELSVRERSGMMEALAAAESLLRDVLVRCESVDAPVVNSDQVEAIDRLASVTSTTGVLRALGHLSAAADDLAHNVSPQLALEAMLFSVKEDLTCPPSSR